MVNKLTHTETTKQGAAPPATWIHKDYKGLLTMILVALNRGFV